MKLYDYLPSGNSYKVRLLLSYLALEYDWVNLDIIAGETHTADYKSRNPVGQIPLLELSDGRTIAESNAILYFLAEGTPYWPSNVFDQAKCLQWMFFEQYKHEPSIAVARFIRTYYPQDRADELPALMSKGVQALDIMEAHLADNQWFVGGGPTIADIALYAYTHVAGEGGFTLSDYPNITIWLDRFSDHPRHIRITDIPS
ncbi:glutathione S-transferase family protein [Fretibacter rubidus]|uniref:glutathione S-transferase family protein n=1 Tax=Fretibacter rubidus TaxID=570162 RepID=UPI00352A6673